MCIRRCVFGDVRYYMADEHQETCWPVVLSWTALTSLLRWLNWTCFRTPGTLAGTLSSGLFSAWQKRSETQRPLICSIFRSPVWGTLTYFLWHFRGKCTDLLLPIISPWSYIIHGILLHAVCMHTPPPRSYYCVLSGRKIKHISSLISRTCWRNLNGWSDLYSYITPARAHACTLTSAGHNRDLDPYPASCCWNPHRWPSAAASSIPRLHRQKRRSAI